MIINELAIIFSVLFGFSCSIMIVGFLVRKSNDRGNSKASFYHFSKDKILHMLNSKNNVRRPR